MLADDTSVLLDGSEKSLDTCLNVLKYFANISGLRINYDKTQIILIGNIKYSNHRLNTGNALEWGKHQFKLLGIEFDVDLDKIFDLNVKQKYEQFKQEVHESHRTPEKTVQINTHI